MALTILNVIVYFLVALCSFETFLSRTECQASRISLCRHADDLSTSLFGDCEANGVWPTKSFHPMLLWPLCVLSRVFLVSLEVTQSHMLGYTPIIFNIGNIFVLYWYTPMLEV